jgi:hypothetical protein
VSEATVYGVEAEDDSPLLRVNPFDLINRDQQPLTEPSAAYLELFGFGRSLEAETGHPAEFTATLPDGEPFAAVQPVVIAVGRTPRIRDVGRPHTADSA